MVVVVIVVVVIVIIMIVVLIVVVVVVVVVIIVVLIVVVIVVSQYLQRFTCISVATGSSYCFTFSLLWGPSRGPIEVLLGAH